MRNPWLNISRISKLHAYRQSSLIFFLFSEEASVFRMQCMNKFLRTIKQNLSKKSYLIEQFLLYKVWKPSIFWNESSHWSQWKKWCLKVNAENYFSPGWTTIKMGGEFEQWIRRYILLTTYFVQIVSSWSCQSNLHIISAMKTSTNH